MVDKSIEIGGGRASGMGEVKEGKSGRMRAPLRHRTREVLTRAIGLQLLNVARVVLTVLLSVVCAAPSSGALPDTVDKIRPGIVAVGTVKSAKRANADGPALNYRGTGFVVGDGRQVVTNAHVIPQNLDVAAGLFAELDGEGFRQFDLDDAGINAMPVGARAGVSISRSASSPPADAPMPTTGTGAMPLS